MIIYLAFTYFVYAFVRKFLAKEKYYYKKFNLIEYIVDVLFIPVMDLFQGKDSHWWDWKEIDVGGKKIDWLVLEKGKTPIRKFKRLPIIGQYNLSGLLDLYKTLKKLRKTAILEPENYSDFWSLLIISKYRKNNKWENQYELCKFKHKGSVKNLLDGEKKYIGITKEGEYIKLKLVEICDRDKYKELLFI